MPPWVVVTVAPGTMTLREIFWSSSVDVGEASDESFEEVLDCALLALSRDVTFSREIYLPCWMTIPWKTHLSSLTMAALPWEAVYYRLVYQ